MRSPLKEGDDASVLPMIKSRMENLQPCDEVSDKDTQAGGGDKPYSITKNRHLLNYKESKDIFEIKFTKDIDR